MQTESTIPHPNRLMKPPTARDASRVLLAEDRPELRQLIALELRAAGHLVEAVDDGDALWARCRDGPAVDLIVTDVRMPGLHGIEVLRRLRRHGIDTPVLVVTAFGDRQLHAEAGALNARVLDKPFDFDDLIDLTADLLGRGEAL